MSDLQCDDKPIMPYSWCLCAWPLCLPGFVWRLKVSRSMTIDLTVFSSSLAASSEDSAESFLCLAQQGVGEKERGKRQRPGQIMMGNQCQHRDTGAGVAGPKFKTNHEQILTQALGPLRPDDLVRLTMSDRRRRCPTNSNQWSDLVRLTKSDQFRPNATNSDQRSDLVRLTMSDPRRRSPTNSDHWSDLVRLTNSYHFRPIPTKSDQFRPSV